MEYKVSYKGWFRHQQKVTSTMTEEEAKRMHEKRKQYHAIVGDETHPYATITVSNTAILIGFLDSKKREYIQYDFYVDETDPKKMLFMRNATFNYYDNISTEDKPIKSELFVFQTDGTYKVVIQDHANKKVEEREYKDPVNTSGLYVEYPEFGHYEKLTVKERNII